MKYKINKSLLLEASSRKNRNNSEVVPCTGIKENLGFTCKKDKNGYFITTHRARSKSYPKLEDVSMKDIKFIDSTG